MLIFLKEHALYVARAGTGPNAEHGIFLKDETYLKTNQLLLGHIFNPDAYVLIGSGVCVNPEWFLREIHHYNLGNRVFVDYRCPVVTLAHMEKKLQAKICF